MKNMKKILMLIVFALKDILVISLYLKNEKDSYAPYQYDIDP